MRKSIWIAAAALLIGGMSTSAFAASFTSGTEEIEFVPTCDTAREAVSEGYSALAHTMIGPLDVTEAAPAYRIAMGLDIGTFAESGRPAVALTFDDGPGDATESILDILEANHAHATFFILGQKAESHAETMQRELSLGCEIGTHSWNHPQLTKMSVADAMDNLSRSISAIEKYSGGKVTVMRPPYGDLSSELKQEIDLPIILWSLDTLDWKTRDARSTVETIQANVKGGDIILFHDLYTETRDAAAEIIPWLIQNGYRLLTVSELYDYYEEDLSLHKGHGCA